MAYRITGQNQITDGQQKNYNTSGTVRCRILNRRISMRKNIIWLLLLPILISCQNKDQEILNYYNTLLQINNELLIEIYETLYETKRCAISKFNFQGVDSCEYNLLKQRFKTIEKICLSNIENLKMIGPHQGDSILYKTFMVSFKQLDSLSRNEFKKILESFLAGEVTRTRTDALYSASLKLAENHISVLDSVSKFNQRYKLDLHTVEIDYHRKKALKLKTDIFRITRSVCLSGNCMDGFGQQQDEDGSLYSGYFRNGLFHGKGKLILSSGDSYEGGFSRGSFEGYGTYTWSTGKKYQGEWREDDPNGVGTMYLETGDTLFGYWQGGALKDFEKNIPGK